MKTRAFVIIYFIFCLFFLAVRVPIDIYLIRVVFINQYLLRRYNHVKGYKAEFLITIIY